MTDAELDVVYTRLCKAMTQLGETNMPLFLARFALLAVEQIDDCATSLRLIDDASEGIGA